MFVYELSGCGFESRCSQLYCIYIRNFTTKKRISNRNSPITEAETTQFKRPVGQLNRVAGISRPDISFSVCKASTKFKNAIVADVSSVRKIIRNLKSLLEMKKNYKH